MRKDSATTLRVTRGLMRSIVMTTVAVLAACGGEHAPAPASPAEVTGALRARAWAVAAQAVPPEEAARQLMDFGEAQFPQYFPSRQPTQSLPPFVYRHYPQTQAYLGVVVTAAAGYELLGVYVMGGPFGTSPQYVGPLASFITPAAAGHVVKVHAGRAGTYAITAAGELFATGIGIGCRLGDGTVNDRPAPVSLGTGWADVSGSDRMLALKTDGSLWGWGSQVGDGTSAQRCAPVKIGDGYRMAHSSSFSQGGAIAVKADGTLWVWGSRPARVGTDTDWVTAVAGESHYLALKADGSLWSWGSSINGELGRTIEGGNQDTPGRVGSGSFKAIAAGTSTSYAIAVNDDLYGWGRSSALWPLGDGMTENRPLPVLIGPGYASVHPGAMRTLALKRDGSVWGWGDNGSFGGRPVGDGTKVPRYEPVRVAEGFRTLTEAENTVLGIDRSGQVWGWDVYDYVRHQPSGNFGVLSSLVPVAFDYFAP